MYKFKKRNLFCLIILIFSISSAFSMSNARLFDKSSFEVKAIDYLARSQRINTILDSYPVTETKMRAVFKKIDVDKLNTSEFKLYNKVNSLLEIDNYIFSDNSLTMDLKIPLSFRGSTYFTSDNKPLLKYEFQNYYRDEVPWLNIQSMLEFEENIFGYAQFMIQDKILDYYPSKQPHFSYNLNSFYIDKDHSLNFQRYQPFKIGASIGDEYYNFQIGRNRLSDGSGLSGNLIIGDNFSKQDYMKFSLYSDFFNYEISTTVFDEQSDHLSFNKFHFSGKNQYRIMHRFNFNLLNNLSLTLYQGSLYFTENLDFRMIIPFMYIHNYFNFADSHTLNDGDEANNIIGAQLKYLFSKGNELNLQIIFDQLQEEKELQDFPNAYGFLLNYKNTSIKEKGILNNYFEVAYTSTYLYLNEKYDDVAHIQPNYNYDHIVGNDFAGHDEIGYSGYTYGPDCFVLSYDLEYCNFDNWEIAINSLFKIKGEKGILFNDKIIDGDIIGSNIVNTFISGVPEYSLSITPRIKVLMDNRLSIEGQMGFINTFNHYNNTDNIYQFNMRAKLLIKWDTI